MRARAAAIDELVDSGVLDDALETGDPLERELQQAGAKTQVQVDLERLKREVGQA